MPSTDVAGRMSEWTELLEVADVLLISASLTHATHGLIGAAELGHMKDDAILVNLARGEIVQERPLYDHLVGHPRAWTRQRPRAERGTGTVCATT
jgi:phosphoglycerate dehydrogenase-like enzyme